MNTVTKQTCRNTPVLHVNAYSYIRPITVEYDSTSVIPSIAVLSMKGIIDPRLKHNGGYNIDLNVSNDPVEIAAIARGVKSTANAIADKIDSSRQTNPQGTLDPEPTTSDK